VAIMLVSFLTRLTFHTASAGGSHALSPMLRSHEVISTTAR